MLVVGENLQELVKQKSICNERRIDDNGLAILLSDTVLRAKPPGRPVVYGAEDCAPFYESRQIQADGLILKPGEAILACSQDEYSMPAGYFGQVQTKGSLARLFVGIHVSDPQVDPGYRGVITLELVNYGPFDVRLPRQSVVGQLYIWKCSTSNGPLYQGRYQSADAPTHPIL